MTLCRLALSNIKKSFKDYSIYFITLILGVSIFYIFNSIDSQTAMLNLSSSTKAVVKLIMTILSAVSVFVSAVLGFLIIYASRFLIKKRNKEFAIYLTLGMSKKKISTMLLIETFLIGILSLGVGLILGILASQITSVFIANLFEANMTKFIFNISTGSIIKTCIYFGIIYIVVMIFNTIIINKCKLIDLLQASKKNEKIKIKNPIVCIIIFIIAALILANAYYTVSYGFYKIFSNKPVSFLLIPIGMGVVGTVMFYYSLSGLFLRVVSSIKNKYYKGLNTFTYKEISSEINTMIVSMSVICIMLFLTICLLSSAISIKNYFNSSINKYAPTDINIMLDPLEDKESEINIEKLYKDAGVYNDFKKMIEFNLYMDENFTYKDSLGTYYDDMKKVMDMSFIMNENQILMKESDYNKLAELNGYEKISLKEGTYAIVSNYHTEYYNEVLKRNTKVNIYGEEFTPMYGHIIEGDYWINANGGNLGYHVVKDDVIDNREYIFKIIDIKYNTEDEDKIVQLNDIISNINYQTEFSYTDKLNIKDSCTGISAMATFIGLYLGIVFLISSAAIISLKSLSDAIEDRPKYKILRNIGASEEEINKALFKQTTMFFILPIILAIVHTIFGIKFCLIILESLGSINLTKPIITTFLIMILIYGSYYIVSYFLSKNIIKDK